MANSHTKVQRAWVIERLAWGHSVATICEKFAIRFPGIRCTPADVYLCDQTIVALSPDEFAIHVGARQFADANPEVIAPALDPKRRQMNMILSAEDARDRKAYDLMAKLYRQVDEAQGLIGPGKAAKTAAAGDAKDELTGIKRVIVDPTTEATP